MAASVEHPLRQPRENREPLLRRVAERKLLEREEILHADQPVDELGRVRRAAADHGELHAATSGARSTLARAMLA